MKRLRFGGRIDENEIESLCELNVYVCTIVPIYLCVYLLYSVRGRVGIGRCTEISIA